jgi:hypothetical protein
LQQLQQQQQILQQLQQQQQIQQQLQQLQQQTGIPTSAASIVGQPIVGQPTTAANGMMEALEQQQLQQQQQEQQQQAQAQQQQAQAQAQQQHHAALLQAAQAAPGGLVFLPRMTQ